MKSKPIWFPKRTFPSPESVHGWLDERQFNHGPILDAGTNFRCIVWRGNDNGYHGERILKPLAYLSEYLPFPYTPADGR